MKKHIKITGKPKCPECNTSGAVVLFVPVIQSDEDLVSPSTMMANCKCGGMCIITNGEAEWFTSGDLIQPTPPSIAKLVGTLERIRNMCDAQHWNSERRWRIRNEANEAIRISEKARE